MLPNTGSRLNKAVPHLQICVTDPGKEGMLLSFSVCTHVNGKDESCLLDYGDHPKIGKLSTIYYGTPHWHVDTNLIKRINSGDLDYHGTTKESVFLKVCCGVLESDFIDPRCKAYIELRWKAMGLKIPP